MTDTKEDDTTKDDVKKQKDQQIAAAHKRLMATGFNKQQAAEQLSSKHAMTVAEVTAIVEQSDGGEQANKSDENDK